MFSSLAKEKFKKNARRSHDWIREPLIFRDFAIFAYNCEFFNQGMCAITPFSLYFQRRRRTCCPSTSSSFQINIRSGVLNTQSQLLSIYKSISPKDNIYFVSIYINSRYNNAVFILIINVHALSSD